MELYHLKTFVTVAEEENLTRAAERLSMSQPAVSSHIKTLEEELGLKLFIRSPRGMALTPAGHEIWDQADRILKACLDLQVKAGSLKGELSGRLHVGINNEAEIVRADQIVRVLSDAYPKLGFQVKYGSSGIMLDRLLARELDVVFYEGPCEHPEVASAHVTDLEICVVGPRAWEEELARPDWEVLSRYPWVFTSPNCSYYRLMEHITEVKKLKLQRRYELDDNDVTVSFFIASQMALSLVPRQVVERSHLRDKLFVWPHFSFSMPLCIGALRSRCDEPAINAFLKAASRAWDKPLSLTAGPMTTEIARFQEIPA
ncbi:MAG: LysR family transcriptional regulator [Verrucomicrobiota bacterium JB022]|nr:LysR family transcriptional regulator [Verrucomicrobiota bacterium JB022]